jgi:hypothetical protein
MQRLLTRKKLPLNCNHVLNFHSESYIVVGPFFVILIQTILISINVIVLDNATCQLPLFKLNLEQALTLFPSFITT